MLSPDGQISSAITHMPEMKIRFRHTAHLIAILALASPVLGQSDLSDFTHYTTRDGLSNSHIRGICQDSNGFVWISTDYGLNRFDGTSFINLTSINEDFKSADQGINNAKYLGHGLLGIGTQYGAYILHTNNYDLQPLRPEVDENLKNWAYHIMDFGTDGQGHFGLSTKTGFYVMDGSGNITDQLRFYTVADIGKSWMLYGRDVMTLPDGRMVQVTSEGYNVFEPGTGKITTAKPIPFPEQAIIDKDPETDLLSVKADIGALLSVNEHILVLHQYSSGITLRCSLPAELSGNLSWRSEIYTYNDSTLIITGNKGFYRAYYDFTSQTIRIDTHLSMPELAITSMFIDQESRMWIGTDQGLYKENSQPIITQHRVQLSPGMPPPVIRYLEHHGHYWYVSTQSSGLLILDDQTYKVVDQKWCRKGERVLPLGKLFFFNDDVLWIASFSGLFSYTLSTGIVQPLTFDNCPDCTRDIDIQDILPATSGDIWVTGNEENTAYRIDDSGMTIQRIEHDSLNHKFRVNIPFRMSEDAQGNIWFCGDAMARYNVSLGKVDSLIEKLPLQRNAKKAFFIHRNSRNDLWFTTNNDNWHILPAGGTFEVCQDDRLSPSIRVYQSLIDDILYYISEQGKLVILNTTNREYRILTQADGWEAEQITSIGFFKNEATHQILFTTKDILYSFDAGLPLLERRNTPFISTIHIIGQRTIDLPGDQLEFQHAENTMQIRFITLNFDDPDNQLFSYKLEGRNPTVWIPIEKPEVLLTRMPPGWYTLSLKVESKNNYWAPSFRTYKIHILAPFYARWTFIIPAAILAGLIIWLLVRRRLREIRTLSNLDRMVVEYELQALHAQMNPHFVFNCLNSIKEMILSGDNTHANIYLNKFSYLLRSTLDQSKLQHVTLAQTIEYLGNYMEMEKLRFEQFRYTIETSKQLHTEQISMAPLLLQPIVENAIWHGLAGQKGLKEIHLRFYAEDQDVVCEIEDYGMGIGQKSKVQPVKDHHSMALSNIRKRIELLNKKTDAEYSLELTDKSDTGTGSGTIVRLRFKQRLHEFD